MGNLNQDARAVAGLRIATRRAAMGQVDEDLKPLADDLVALFAANAGDQTHTAGIVLIPWVIETLRLRSAETIIRCIHGSLFDDFFIAECVACPERHNTLCDSCRGKSPGLLE